MASRNGLNPQIRSFKGVGWNRALPAPFGFDKGFTGDNISNYFTVPRLVGVNMPMQFTVEFWVKIAPTFNNADYASGGYFGIQDTSLNTFYMSLGGATSLGFNARTPNGGFANPPNQMFLNAKNHVVVSFDFINNTVAATHNGNLALRIQAPAGAYTQAPIREVNVYRNIVQYCGGLPIDEFRLYNRVISDLEITTNYNSGIGLNASITENMLLWYKFEAFESLDFSLFQDGSNMQIGIRDISGKNNHALPQGGIITDPASPGYTLLPF